MVELCRVYALLGYGGHDKNLQLKLALGGLCGVLQICGLGRNRALSCASTAQRAALTPPTHIPQSGLEPPTHSA